MGPEAMSLHKLHVQVAPLSATTGPIIGLSTCTSAPGEASAKGGGTGLAMAGLLALGLGRARFTRRLSLTAEPGA